MGYIPETPDTVVITEGYATALSLYVVGGELVLAAIDAGNLLSVAQAVRERWPQTSIIIAGDNDVTPEGENVGLC
ncbi:toprim domain-containing protein [Symbiopectobacterium sp. Eva_TO]